MARKKRKKELSEFDKKFPKKHDGMKAGDEILYKRMSDESLSIGTIKFFHLDPTLCVVVVDLMLGNFQTALISDIIRNPTPDMVKSMWLKVGKAASKHDVRSKILKKKKAKKS